MAWRIGVPVGLAAGIIQIAFALLRPTSPPLLKEDLSAQLVGNYLPQNSPKGRNTVVYPKQNIR
jgi:hypothetical protein